MTEAVNIAGILLMGSMAAIVVGATLAGALLYWLDGSADHGDAH